MKRLHSGWPYLLREDLELLTVLLGAEFRLLATNFICTHLHDRAISVCMQTIVRLEILRDCV